MFTWHKIEIKLIIKKQKNWGMLLPKFDSSNNIIDIANN